MLSNNENLEKYDINNFYIGELVFIEQINLSNDISNIIDIKNKKNILLSNGAIEIDISNYFLDTNNWKKKIRYHKILTIFYKYNDEYLCLHDGNTHKINNECFYDNLITLSNMLPKVSYNIPRQITTIKALFMYEQIFKKSVNLEKVYNNTKYKITDFYIGTLTLNTGYLPQGKRINPKLLNIPSKYILSKNARNIGVFGRNLDENELLNNKIIPGRYLYTMYKCLFLKVPNGLYNINNFQIYEKGVLEKTSFKERPIGESYYENIIPITKQIEGIKDTKVSIPKVLHKIK